jgi:3-hydroxyacyl-CoA dehydrogenase/enoyl-CoA hydratase/3-hydroxybutyryl-CoA epimerase/enoyl-CoA isomerase
MGPAYLLDVVGIDTAHHAQAVMAEGFPKRMGKDVIDALFESDRYGQKNGTGFYQYRVDKKGRPKKTFSDEILPLISSVCAVQQTFDEDTIMQRMMIPIINEVVLCLEEGIIAPPQEADMALVYGLGFLLFRGGVFRYLDSIGIAEFIAMAKQYADLGAMYQPSQMLIDMAERGESFYQTQQAGTL